VAKRTRSGSGICSNARAHNPASTPVQKIIAKSIRKNREDPDKGLREGIQEIYERWPDQREVVVYIYDREGRTAFTKFAKELIKRGDAIDYTYRSKAQVIHDGASPSTASPMGEITMKDKDTRLDSELFNKLLNKHYGNVDLYDDDYRWPREDNPQAVKRRVLSW